MSSRIAQHLRITARVKSSARRDTELSLDPLPNCGSLLTEFEMTVDPSAFGVGRFPGPQNRELVQSARQVGYPLDDEMGSVSTLSQSAGLISAVLEQGGSSGCLCRQYLGLL